MQAPVVEPAIPAIGQEIPDKLYFRIGEVSRLAGIKPYVLRYWETEFSQIGPKKSGTGHRLYRRKDVELVLEIKRLLYEKRFTIEGARKFLEAKQKPPEPIRPARKRGGQGELFGMAEPAVPVEGLAPIRRELEAILALLK